jgi:hypothetical protein
MTTVHLFFTASPSAPAAIFIGCLQGQTLLIHELGRSGCDTDEEAHHGDTYDQTSLGYHGSLRCFPDERYADGLVSAAGSLGVASAGALVKFCNRAQRSAVTPNRLVGLREHAWQEYPHMRGAADARQELGPDRKAIWKSAEGHRDRHGRQRNRRSFHRDDPHVRRR